MTQNPWNPSTSMGDLGLEKQNQEGARNEETESVPAWVIWD